MSDVIRSNPSARNAKTFSALRSTLLCILMVLCAAACQPPAGGAVAEPGDVAVSTNGLASFMGGVEATIDAPWRLEPNHGGGLTYPAIPIVLSIHDASTHTDPSLSVGQFCDLEIIEALGGGENVVTWIDPPQLVEIERSDEWTYDSDIAAGHRLCRGWAGDDCTNELDVGSAAEWHATVLYTPRTQTPGADVRLVVQARVADAARTGGGCESSSRDTLVIGLNSGRDTLGKRGFSTVTIPDDYYVINHLSVHLGEAPLPRFDDGWVYGDLHYHSQGTDNEGESGYAYRPTLQAMRAIGLDFVFATDHASNSGQATDFEVLYINNVNIDLVPGFIEDMIERMEFSIGAETFTDARRDMSDPRWRVMRAWLNDSSGWAPPRPGTGANAEVMKLPGRAAAPRMFLGGEVDVIPEISEAERVSGYLNYGRDKKFRWSSACTDIPDEILRLQEWTNKSECRSSELIKEAPEGGRYKLKDMQGLGDTSFYGRQHLIHLPFDGARTDGFVTSDTTLWGGAQRRLYSFDPVSGLYGGLLYEEYEVENKGYAFLAHPVAAPSGRDLGRLGPDIVPFSDVQLQTAFASQAVLGLQLWNEDNRLNGRKRDFTWWDSRLYRKARGISSANDAYALLDDGLAAWDKMLLWGIRPTQTAGIAWLPAGAPRKVFMAGGSDAHGDLNYRREGATDGVSGTVDTAIGKPRNLVHVGSARPETVFGASGEPYGAVGQQQVTAALGTGEFSITDGPALRIAVDMNGNGRIDQGDVPMGGVTDVAPSGSRSVPLLIEWKSTPEFGPIAAINLYVGAANDALDEGLIYAPLHHGVQRPGAGLHPFIDSIGNPHVLTGGSMLDPTGRLSVTPGGAESMAGTRLVHLRPDDYVVGRLRTYQDPASCTPNPLCNKVGFEQECSEEPEFCDPPPPPTYAFEGSSRPDRIFVRAFARTALKAGALCNGTNPTDPAQREALLSEACVERLAFTNPIWVRNPPQTCSVPGTACEAPVSGPWSSCQHGGPNVCAGNQSRPTATFTCSATRVCTQTFATSSRPCPLNDGLTCSSPTFGSWGACTNCPATQTRTRNEFACNGGSCMQARTATETRGCVSNSCNHGCTGGKSWCECMGVCTTPLVCSRCRSPGE